MTKWANKVAILGSFTDELMLEVCKITSWANQQICNPKKCIFLRLLFEWYMSIDYLLQSRDMDAKTQLKSLLDNHRRLPGYKSPKVLWEMYFLHPVTESERNFVAYCIYSYVKSELPNWVYLTLYWIAFVKKKKQDSQYRAFKMWQDMVSWLDTVISLSHILDFWEKNIFDKHITFFI